MITGLRYFATSDFSCTRKPSFPASLIRAALLILFTASVNSQAAELKPFTTDGCSLFPNGTLAHKSLWLNCCIEHDKRYWRGGSYSERVDADIALKACVAQVGQPEIAELMLSGVRVGGTPYFPTKFRWGYGWDYPRGYKTLTEEEMQIVQSEVARFEQHEQQELK